MITTFQSILQQLEAHIQTAHQSGNKYDFIDPAYKLCLMLMELDNPTEAIEPLFRLIERSPDIDYGGPGPLGQFLESFDETIYEDALLDSLQRKPAFYTIHLLDTMLQDSDSPRQAFYLETMRAIAVNPTLSDDLRKEVINNLRYALENLPVWTTELAEQMTRTKKWIDELFTEQATHRDALSYNERLPPIPVVSYEGLFFKLITRTQAQVLLPNITDLQGINEPLYDVWNESHFPTCYESAYFLFCDENVTTEKLELCDKIPGFSDMTILGFIFTGNLWAQSHILTVDNAHSPVLIVHGDVTCPCIHLFGNSHYIGGHVSSELVWTKSNRGELYLNGSIDAQVILADDMPIYIRQMNKTAAIVSIMGMNIYLKKGADWLQQPATHGIEELFVPEVFLTDEEGETVLDEGESGLAIEYIKQNRSLLK